MEIPWQQGFDQVGRTLWYRDTYQGRQVTYENPFPQTQFMSALGTAPIGGMPRNFADPTPQGRHLEIQKKSTRLDDDDDWEYENTRRGNCCSNERVLKQEYGTGVYLYFQFIKFNACIDFLLALIALCSFIPQTLHAESITANFPESLFISAFVKELKLVWVVTSVAMCILMLFSGKIYKSFHTNITSKWEGEGREEEAGEREDEIIYTDKNGARVRHASAKRRFHKFISLFLTFVTLSLQVVLMWMLHDFLEKSDSSDEKTAVIVSLFITVFKAVFKKVAKKLTQLELHTTWTAFRKWDLVKLFIFKLSNVLILYAVKYQSMDSKDCPLSALGDQFFYLIVTDMTVTNVIEVVSPLTLNFVKKKILKNKGSDESLKSTFDVADEYVEALYRQFIIFLGSLVFPMIGFLGAIGNVLEYWLDKVRLVYICKKPERIEPWTHRPISFLLFLITIASLFSFPNGALFIFFGFNMSSCTFFQS